MKFYRCLEREPRADSEQGSSTPDRRSEQRFEELGFPENAREYSNERGALKVQRQQG
jgi:hypothetical protein